MLDCQSPLRMRFAHCSSAWEEMRMLSFPVITCTWSHLTCLMTGGHNSLLAVKARGEGRGWGQLGAQRDEQVQSGNFLVLNGKEDREAGNAFVSAGAGRSAN
jgi:hypothetical protein